MSEFVKVVAGVSWIKIPDGEFNEHVAAIRGRKVTISSDRDGRKWNCCIDDEELTSLEATCLQDAIMEALGEAP